MTNSSQYRRRVDDALTHRASAVERAERRDGPSAAARAGGEFRCPVKDCDGGPFESTDEWADHEREAHGVEGPL